MITYYDRILNYFEDVKLIFYDNMEVSFFELFEKDIDSGFDEIEKVIHSNESILDRFYDNYELSEHLTDVLKKNMEYSLIELKSDDIIGLIEIKEKLNILENKIIGFIKEVKKIKYLSNLEPSEKITVVVGANGSGKSTLVDFFKGTLIADITTITSRKDLRFEKKLPYGISAGIKKEGFIEIQRSIYAKRKTDRYDRDYMFSIVIHALLNEYMDILHIDKKNEESSVSLYDKFIEVWNHVIPDIEIDVVLSDRSLVAKKHGQDYCINELSEGEKSIILYISSVLLASEKSYIIVDEPEVHLNNSLASKLWNRLTEIRNDCKFIFVSHDLNFITSMANHKLVWCKSFSYPDEWDLEEVPSSIGIPSGLIVELVGSRKNILFCEGDNKSSYDFKVYSALFREKYDIVPVGGHREVIKYVSAYNDSKVFKDNKAIGIIDGDYIYSEKVEEKHENIFSIPFNEIEMLLLEGTIIDAVLGVSYSAEKSRCKKSKFMDEFFSEFSKNKEKIAVNQLREDVNHHFEGEGIEGASEIDAFKENFKKLTDYDVDEEYQKYYEITEDIHKNRDYKGLLKICHLKGQISRGIANKNLDSDYLDKAVRRLEKDENLRESFKSKYFPDIT